MDRVVIDNTARRKGFGERAFAVGVILLSTGAFANLWFTAERAVDPRAGVALLELFWAATYIYSMLILWRNCRGSFRRLLQEKWILALVGLTLCSAAWSAVPLVTLRHAIAIAAGCLFSLYVVERFTFNEQLEILAWAFGLAAVFSFVFGAFNWGSAVIEVPGWIGIYSHKNVLGRTMAMGALIFSLLSEHLQGGKWVARVGVASCLTLIVLSQSVTSMVIVLPLLYAKHLFRLTLQGRRGIRRRVWVSILVATVCIAWVVSDFERVSELLDRDPTLTGRTILWAIIIPMAMEKPWLGYGYGSFWLGEEGPSMEVWQLHGFPTANGHNGLLDILLDLGLLGALITILGFGSFLRKAFRVYAAERTWDNAWPILFLMALFLINLAETDFLAPNVFFWFVYVGVALQLSERAAALQAAPVHSNTTTALVPL
jgi:O-antigen ligase